MRGLSESEMVNTGNQEKTTQADNNALEHQF